MRQGLAADRPHDLRARAARASGVALVALAACGCAVDELPARAAAVRWDDRDGPFIASVPEHARALDGASRGRTLWLRLEPPDVEAPVAVQVDDRADEVVQGGRTIYRAGGGLPVVVLPSPADPLFVRYVVREPGFALRTPCVFGRADTLAWSALRATLSAALVGVTLAITAAFLLVLAARRRQRDLVHLAGFSAAIGAMIFATGYPASALIVPWPGALRWTMNLGTLLYPVFFARFVDFAFLGGRDRALRLIALGSLVWAGAAVALALAFIVPLGVAREWSYVLVLVLIARTLGVVVPRALRGDADARIFSVGFLLLVLVSGPGILEGMGVRALAGADLTHWGMLLFVASLGVLLERRMRQQASELARTSGDLATKVLALETREGEVQALNAELREQVAQRSRELAEALAHPAVRSAALQPDDLVDGRYRVIRRLGHGGMGEVFEVERSTDRRRFALKVMHEARDSSDVGRFAREAEIAARLEHACLVRVVDLGYAAGLLYLVMELVEGTSLDAHRGRFGERAWALGVLRGVASGLCALHAAGIVHRDLKPGNVLVDEHSGGVKITDFGIARVDEAASPLGDTAPAGASRGDLTMTGALVGTPHYMAPELARGARGAKAPSDIWSFGVLAYELLTGELPFRVPAVYDAFAGHTPHEPPPLADRCEGLAPELGAMLDRAFRLDPSQRPTAAELRAALA